MTLNSGGGFAWSLVAAGPLPEAIASLPAGSNCESPSPASAATCTTGLGVETAGVDLCFTTGCAAAKVMLVDDYATSLPPATTGDRTSMSYASAPAYPSASVTYTPSPITHWRYDSSLPGIAVVTATLAESPVVAFRTGETLDFTFSGEANGVVFGSSASFFMHLSFPKLTSGGVVEVTMRGGSGGHPSGALTVGGKQVATMTDGKVVWQGVWAN